MIAAATEHSRSRTLIVSALTITAIMASLGVWLGAWWWLVQTPGAYWLTVVAGGAVVPARMMLLTAALRMGATPRPSFVLPAAIMRYLRWAALIEVAMLLAGWAVLPAPLWLLQCPARVLTAWWIYRINRPRVTA